MIRRLPPMGAIEAFVVVARCGSLKAASHELNLSVSALSRRIQSLETYVGRDLFRRLHHELRLTEDGHWLFSRVESSFNALSDVLAELHRVETRTLRVSMPASFAASWLLPRLSAFKAENPSLELALDTASPTPARLSGGVDVAILLAETVDGDLYTRRLKQPAIYAVCAPDFARQHEGLPPSEVIGGSTLLVHRDLPKLAEAWLDAMQISAPQRMDRFDMGPTLFEAAANGLGVAIAPADSITSFLQSGRLVRLFSEDVASPYAYHFACRQTAMLEWPIRRFHDWVVGQIETTPDSPMPGHSPERLAS